jgi:hypothetical protein
LKEVRDASQLAVEASKGGTTLSEHTTESAREIALITQQQRKATTQVDQAMEEMTQLLHHTIASIKQATSSAESLSRVSRGIATIIRPDAAKDRATPVVLSRRMEELPPRRAGTLSVSRSLASEPTKESTRTDAL